MPGGPGAGRMAARKRASAEKRGRRMPFRPPYGPFIPRKGEFGGFSSRGRGARAIFVPLKTVQKKLSIFAYHVPIHRPLCGHEKTLRRIDHPLPAGGRNLFDDDASGRRRAGHHQQPGADCDRLPHARSAGGRAAHHLPHRGGDEQHHERPGDSLRIALRSVGRHGGLQGERADSRRPAAHQRTDTDRRRRDSPPSWAPPR